MIQEKINKLIPFISQDFLSYPLWEEGKYIPFISFWQKADNIIGYSELQKSLKKLCSKTGYVIDISSDYERRSVIYNMQIYPDFKDLKNGSYKFVKKDWSIEEMLEMLDKFLSNRSEKRNPTQTTK